MAHRSGPHYADRETGEQYESARSMIDAYLVRFAARAATTIEPLDEAGYTHVRKGSASIGINVLEQHGVLALLAPIMEVPPPQSAGGPIALEPFYRRLLELSFLATSDAAFGIDADKNEVYVRALRRLSGLDYEEFEDLIETVGTVADAWDDVLRREFGHP